MATSDNFFFPLFFSLHIWRASLAHLFPKESFIIPLAIDFFFFKISGGQKNQKKKKKKKNTVVRSNGFPDNAALVTEGPHKGGTAEQGRVHTC
jgi:hypothetical protein